MLEGLEFAVGPVRKHVVSCTPAVDWPLLGDMGSGSSTIPDDASRRGERAASATTSG